MNQTLSTYGNERRIDGLRVGDVRPAAWSHIRILGSVQMIDQHGRAHDVASATQRRLLAFLALRAGETVRSEVLSEHLDLSAGALRTMVSRVRRTIGEHAVVTTSVGYRFEARVDANLFTQLLSEARTSPDRLVAYDRALALWRGEVLDEFRHECWAMGAVARLDGLRSGVVEDRVSELISRGRFDDAIASLETHIAENPLRDRPRGQLMEALAADGRQTDALRAYQRYRLFLAEEAGTEPSAEVQELERRIVRGVTAKRRVRLAHCPDSVTRSGRRPLVMLRA